MSLKYDFHNTVLRRVKNTFHKMTFTYRHFNARNHNMIAINSAPETGHRDAAFDCAAKILQLHLFALPAEKRLASYTQAMDLLHVSISSSIDIFNSSSGNKHDHEANVLSFLHLLNDTVQAAATLLSHQQNMIEEDRNVTDFFGFDLAFHFQSADDVLAESEVNIIQCVKEMLDLSHARLMQYRGYCCRTLAGKDLKRYHKAFAEYQKLYSEKYPLATAVDLEAPMDLETTQLLRNDRKLSSISTHDPENNPPQA